MSISAEGYEPPDTTGGEDDCPEDGDGVCDGCWSPLPEPEPLVELEPDELDPLVELELGELEEDVDWLAEPAVDVVCPWKDLAAANEMAPLTTTAPASIHRLTREIRASPASRALVALGFTTTMIGPRRKKLLNRR